MLSWTIVIILGLAIAIFYFLILSETTKIKKGDSSLKEQVLCEECLGTGRKANDLFPGLIKDDKCSKCNGSGKGTCR